ncbi:hypothetical protein [Aliarcobacter butzleri]
MSDKVRVFEIAEEVGKTSVEVMQKAKFVSIFSGSFQLTFQEKYLFLISY